MTKVLRNRQGARIAPTIWLMLVALAIPRTAAENPPEKPAEAVYLQLGQVGLDPGRVYQVRGASLDRPAVHITLEDGTIAFTQDVMGRITGAFFEGEGEVLLTPPNDVERRSMSLFTGMAILEERFSTAYLRFNDDLAAELRPDLRAADNPQEFVERWKATAQNLAQADAMRLLVSFSRMLPVKEGAGSLPRQETSQARNEEDRFLHARLLGTRLGIFDVYFDSRASEGVEAGQARKAENGTAYYDVWTSFSPREAGKGSAGAGGTGGEKGRPREDRVNIRRFTITAEVRPPKEVRARARLQLEIREDGARALLFELSRFLQVESVTQDGQVVEFIHNPAVEGTQLARQGNDIVAVILAEPAQTGQRIELEFAYAGEVLAQAGDGLLYVGARGTWYPNRGLAMADFDLEFGYPAGWTLVATGKPFPPLAGGEMARAAGEETSRWVSERPIPVAGFNLGKYKVAKTQAGNVLVETYATPTVEKSFPNAPIQTIETNPSEITPRAPQFVVPSRPSPAQHGATVGELAAEAIRYYAARFGPFPYSRLQLTQLPGHESQGWPGLVFLSSYAFLDKEERQQLHFAPYRILLQESIPAHETAHQWWGDLITWRNYRDQWFSEGLANYSALMMLQEKNAEGFREIMEKYRQDLVVENKEGMAPKDAGPVTLGVRLLSSRFPEGYEAITYGRATWLFHMLRTMLKDAAAQQAEPKGREPGTDEPFGRALRRLREKYEGKSISTRELLDVFADDLPPALRYEGRNSLDWFLDGWINGTALPKLELKAVKLAPKGAETAVSGTILQKHAPQNLVTSVPLYGVISGQRLVLLGRVFADGEESSFHLNGPAGIRKIVLDPYETVLTHPK